jgi:hypothetical protein
MGTNVSTPTWGVGGSCSSTTDVPSTTLKWRNFTLTGAAVQIATVAAPTLTTGATSTMCVATQQVGVFAQSGTYQATITATATAL